MAAVIVPLPCTVVLHDDNVSDKPVLCGSKLLTEGRVGRLSVKGATPLVVVADAQAAGPNEISLHVSLGQRFGLEHRTTATLQPIEDASTVTAAHVEMSFKDQHLSRADIWRLMRQLDRSALYKGQEVSYLGSPVATVEAIYISGGLVHSGIVSQAQSKPIFRSASARFTILIQISKEMLEQWRSGYLMYELLIDGFLAELFDRWEAGKTKHRLRIILFGRYNAPDDKSIYPGERDFYQVLSAEASVAQGSSAIRQLKQIFNSSALPRQVSLAADGNLAEAFQLAARDFMDESDDVHLNSTGSSIIAITAGSGLFSASYNLLKRTTHMLMGNSIGVDLVSLANKPLHPVPLFRYEQDGQYKYALPHWLDISYWNGRDGDAAGLSLPTTAIRSIPVALAKLRTGHTATVADSVLGKISTFDAQLLHGVSERSRKATFIDEVQTPGESSEDRAKLPQIEHLQKSTLGNVLHAGIQSPKKDNSGEVALPSTQDNNVHSRKERVSHPLLKTRNISLGPRGLALDRGTASLTVSSAYAGQEKDHPQTPRMESSAGLAKHIRASLARKPSQQSLISQPSPSIPPTRPIDIKNHPDSRSTDLESLTTLHEDGNEGDSRGHDDKSTEPLSATPKAVTELARSVTTDSITSVQQQMAPWVTLLNPSNPRRDNMRIASQYRKWQHVFPKAIKSGAFKWASMCSPAMLPMTTEYKPSQSELDKDYRVRKRRILHTSMQGSVQSTGELMDELVSLRLVRGFQIVIERPGEDATKSPQGNHRVLLAKGNRYHEIQRLDQHAVEVSEFDLKVEGAEGWTPNMISHYRPLMQPELCQISKRVEIDLLPRPRYLDWDVVDHSALNPNVGKGIAVISKMRIVLIPAEFPRHDPAHTRHKDLTDDERRIEGIQRLTQFWQRHQVFPTTEKVHHASLARPKTSKAPVNRDPNPLAIEYETRDPSAVVQAHGPALLRVSSSALFIDSDMYHSSNYDVTKLVRHMQQPPPSGVEVKDRRWFTRIHLKCFRGDEMTNWLLRVFKDLTYRDDAVALGNDLVKRGIFTHVRHKHDFEDGNYFYQIASAHRITEYPDTSNFFGKMTGRSVPPTPTSEARRSPDTRPFRGDSEESSRTDSSEACEKKTMFLTGVLHYNADERGASKEPEVINVHYDRIHNPENCYHIQLDWMETTAKLIRESIARWASLVESHGLRLVQVPVAEATKLHHRHAFDQPFLLKLAKRPPAKVLATPTLDAQSFSPRHAEDNHAYHKALLRKFDFVLDFEASGEFESSLKVVYSWGKPEYTMTQFVHRSGLLLAQVANNDTADFLLLPNRLAVVRAPTSSRLREGISAAPSKSRELVASLEIVKALTSFCHDSESLSSFYEGASKPRLSIVSPLSNASSKDLDVPPMQLPPHILHRLHTSGGSYLNGSSH
ncbi:hypothetical protein K431DRAFT_303305 [Polychaeton citri CBS 116435]|uniref:Vacuolar membrane-associated protein IML1 n=1 Tax=Polychaeton citri CBS 116435 TaxID=1314669 RepID=A0A9P4UQ64_9PEZI|nr:hypothetical protein K431DRAFT_303305 [Polychaeton citri CBS 116435]